MPQDNKSLQDLQLVLNDPSTAIRLGLFNADRHSDRQAFAKWEEVEPGCTNGILNAYKNMLSSIDNDLSREIVEQVRIALYREGSYGNNIDRMKVDDIIKIPNSSIAFRMSLTVTETELKQFDAQELMKSVGLEELPYRHRKPWFHRAESQEITEQYLYKIIERYNNEEKTLHNILKMVRDLERTHPYLDFNSRTFVVLILNRELIKNGFTPCIIEDPNLFDYQSLEDLERLVHEGQQNFAYLCEHGIVHPQDPTNQQWYNAIQSSEVQQQFHKITQNLYRPLEQLNSLNISQLLKSLTQYKKEYEVHKGIVIEHAQQFDYLTSAGLSLDKLKNIDDQNPEKAQWLVKNGKSVYLLNQAGFPYDKLIDIRDTDPKTTQKLMLCTEHLEKLQSLGLSNDKLQEIWNKEDYELVFWLMEGRESIEWLTNDGLPINELVDIYNKEPENHALANWLVENASSILALHGVGISLQQLTAVREKDPDLVEHIITNFNQINPFLRQLEHANPIMCKFALENIDIMVNLHKKGLSVPESIKELQNIKENKEKNTLDVVLPNPSLSFVEREKKRGNISSQLSK
ncbi:hypothetical protein [Candidatus Tisiphia endosymbiont of Beris chalybata]|uniref:hypothetical protein n=1 Tax=Candidatus Tisiphia endosymbiont of Beris chalybata TaxID=3066262 RepID=UPI00312CB23C